MVGRGGSRVGAGRKKVATKVVRLKLDQVDRLRDFMELRGGFLPFYTSLPASFGVSVESEPMQLNLIRAIMRGVDPAGVVSSRISGNSMIKAGIYDGDLAVINTKAEPKNGQIVAVAVDGELTAKRLSVVGGQRFLVPENDELEARELTPFNDVHCLGVILTTQRDHSGGNLFDFAE